VEERRENLLHTKAKMGSILGAEEDEDR